MPRVPPTSLVSAAAGEGSAVVAARIASVRRLQIERRGALNAVLSGSRLRSACRLGTAEQARLVSLAEGLELSARGVERLLRTARTVADLEESADQTENQTENQAAHRNATPAGSTRAVGRRHLDEAGRFRALGVRSTDQIAV